MYLTYLQMVTSGIGDATKELREKTKDLCLDEIIEGVRGIEKGGTIKMRAKIIALGIALVFLLSASASMAFALSNSGGRDWGYYEAMIKEGK